MRSRRPASASRTWFVCRRLRVRLVGFLVRMWLRLAWPALYLPEAVFRQRLAAPRCVLILGIAFVLEGFLLLARAVAMARWVPPRFPSCPCRLVSPYSRKDPAGSGCRTFNPENRAAPSSGSGVAFPD